MHADGDSDDGYIPQASCVGNMMVTACPAVVCFTLSSMTVPGHMPAIRAR